MNWTFARNINNMGTDGIVDIDNQTLLCLCHEEQSKIILTALASLPSAAPQDEVKFTLNDMEKCWNAAAEAYNGQYITNSWEDYIKTLK